MYSYEERLRAVKLYLKLGKRCKATINQLGYPTKNALKAWHDEFERRGNLQAEYARSKPKYSDEQRNVAVEHWANHGRCCWPRRSWRQQLQNPIRRPQQPYACYNWGCANDARYSRRNKIINWS